MMLELLLSYLWEEIGRYNFIVLMHYFIIHGVPQELLIEPLLFPCSRLLNYGQERTNS